MFGKNYWFFQGIGAENLMFCKNIDPWDKEHLALRNNFRVTKKFLIAKFDCSSKMAPRILIFQWPWMAIIHLSLFPFRPVPPNSSDIINHF